MFLRLCALILFLTLPASVAFAKLKLEHRWEVSGSVQHRELNQNGFSELQNQTDEFFLLALEQDLTADQWSFEIRPELRVLHSPSLETKIGDLSRIPVMDQSRAMDLHYQLHPKPTEDSSSVVVTDIEKLNLRFQGGPLEILAGRNPFNPSIMRLSPIWNKFGKDIFYVGYPNFQFNPDMTLLKLQASQNLWVQNVNVHGKQPEQNAYLMMFGANFGSVEAQLLAGNWWKQKAIGGNFSLSTDESLWKTEILHIQEESAALPSHTEGAMGFERSWTDSFSTVSEVLLSNLPESYSDPRQISLGASPFLRLRSKSYLATELDYQINEFWLGSLIPIINLEDSSAFTVVSLKGNLSDNLEITGNLRFGLGEDGTEFSGTSIEFPNQRYIGTNDIASVIVKYFFR